MKAADLRIAGDPAEIRTYYVLTKILGRYRHTNLLRCLYEIKYRVITFVCQLQLRNIYDSQLVNNDCATCLLVICMQSNKIHGVFYE